MSVKYQAIERDAGSSRLFLAVVVTAILVTTLTGSMITVVLPIIRAEFAASAAHLGWVVTGYVLAYAIGVPLYGRISDVWGVRRVFVFGLLGFAFGGVICALAPSFAVLVVGRTIQGIGGAAVPALASVAVAKVMPPGQRGAALGITASSVGIGSSLGPVLGGLGGELLGWRALFAGSLLLMLLVVPLAQRVLPNDGAAGERRFDLIGGVLLGLSAGLLLWGITQGQTQGFAAASSWGSFVGAALSLAGFVWRIKRARHPFVPPALFRHRAYLATLLVGFCTMLANLSALVFVPLLLVEVNGLAPSVAGLALTPAALALALLSPLMGRLSDRIGGRPIILGGLGIMLLALLWLASVAGAAPLLVAGGMVLMGVGSACIQSPLNNAATNALPREALGGGMGIFVGTFFLGGATGPALFGAWLAARQAGEAAAILPWYQFGAAPFSDTFLMLALAPLVALGVGVGLWGRRPAPHPHH